MIGINSNNQMKSNTIVLSLAGLLASGLVALAQTSVPASDTNQPAAPAAASPATNAADSGTTPAATPAPVTNAVADTTATAGTNAATPAAATGATDATPAPAPTTATSATPSAPAAAAATSDASATPSATPATPTPATPAPADATPAAAATTADATSAGGTSAASSTGRDPNAVIPLIVMDEVPLTDAIKNLARQAGLNYMLDPKINYGGLGPDGRPVPQPMVSLRWENLTPDQALGAVLNNYNLVILDDPKTHTARITIKDPAAPDPLVTKIIQLKYAYATNLVGNVQAVLQDRRSKVIADGRTSQLVVVATEKELVGVDELVARLDTPTKQVLIEARLIETSKNPTTAKGIDWTGTLQAQHFSFGNGQTLGTVTSTQGNTTAANTGTGSLPVGNATAPYIGPNPVTLSTTFPAPPGSGGTSTTIVTATGTGATQGTTYGQSTTTAIGNGGLGLNTAKGFFPATAFLNADGVSAVLSFLNSDLDSRVISTPRSVTLDNETADLSVTTAYPIFQTTAGTQGSPGGASVTYTNVGTILHVTPRISANNTIALKVIPEVSSLAGTITKTVGGVINQADVFDVRRIETQVLIPSGNTLVMGGLIADNQQSGYTKVPGFGDIPFLGAAFRSSNKTQNKRNLLIFITPTIVQNEDFQPTETTFLKTKVNDGGRMDFGAWDSGKPQDWSKLFKRKKAAADGDTDADNN